MAKTGTDTEKKIIPGKMVGGERAREGGREGEREREEADAKLAIVI